MQYLECGKLRLPLCYVQSIAWSRRARTKKTTGGYSRSIGFEGVEISVRATFSVAVAQANGRNMLDDYILFDTVAGERMDTPNLVTLGGYPVVPSLQFAITSVNRTRNYDLAYDPTIECDIILAGVRVSKEASRARIMMFEADEGLLELPAITLSCEGKDLELSGAYALQEFKAQPDGCAITVAISDDMSIASQQGFMESLLQKEGTFSVGYLSGKTRYWIADAVLSDNILSISGTVLPPDSQQTYVKSYWDTKLGDILGDLSKRMKVKCENKFADFTVGYFQSRTTPMVAIQSLCDSAGLIMSWRQNSLVFAEPPSVVAAQIELEAIDTPDDTGAEVLTGCDWRDGINRQTVGDLSGHVLHIQSAFRTESKQPARNCLLLAQQVQRVAVIETVYEPRIVHGSAVSINSNGTMKSGYVSSYEIDFLSGLARYEVNVVL